MRIAVYSGSFNPVHNGHYHLAMYLTENDIADEIWLIVSPQNPWKTDAELISKEDRFRMVEVCFSGNEHIKPSDVEFNLPVPSYSIDTLNYLRKTYPQHQFLLIIGSDNAVLFDQWKSFDEILTNFPVMVYPRNGFPVADAIAKFPVMTVLNTPLYDVSSTEIRNKIQQGRDVSELIQPQVLDYILAKNLYQ